MGGIVKKLSVLLVAAVAGSLFLTAHATDPSVADTLANPTTEIEVFFVETIARPTNSEVFLVETVARTEVELALQVEPAVVVILETSSRKLAQATISVAKMTVHSPL